MSGFDDGVIDLGASDQGAGDQGPAVPDPQEVTRIPADLGAPVVPPPTSPEAVADAQIGGIGNRLKARAARAADATELFDVPVTDEDDPLRLIVEARVIRDQAQLVRSAANDAKFVEASTVRVFWTEEQGAARDLDRDALHEIAGGWSGVGQMMDLPPAWKAHRAVLAACESNPLLVGELAGEILNWSRGRTRSLAADLGT